MDKISCSARAAERTATMNKISRRRGSEKQLFTGDGSDAAAGSVVVVPASL
jgi:hypothetical protein